MASRRAVRAVRRRRRETFGSSTSNIPRRTFFTSPTNGATRRQHANRADVVFLINGIPVAIAERKTQRNRTACRGRRPKSGVITSRRQRCPSHAGLRRHAPDRFLLRRDVEHLTGRASSTGRTKRRATSRRRSRRFFDRERFLRIWNRGSSSTRRTTNCEKIVLRQHQTRAVEKVVERALDPEKKTGLVWHTQGVGKDLHHDQVRRT